MDRLTLPENADAELRKVFGAYVRGGRVDTVPTKPVKRALLLGLVVGIFELGRRYDELEVNRMLMPLCDDYISLRRYLVDADLLARDGHGTYWRSDLS